MRLAIDSILIGGTERRLYQIGRKPHDDTRTVVDISRDAKNGQMAPVEWFAVTFDTREIREINGAFVEHVELLAVSSPATTTTKEED